MWRQNVRAACHLLNYAGLRAEDVRKTSEGENGEEKSHQAKRQAAQLVAGCATDGRLSCELGALADARVVRVRGVVTLSSAKAAQ